MTQWQVTYPNKWYENTYIYPLSAILLGVCVALVAWEFVAAELPKRGAR